MSDSPDIERLQATVEMYRQLNNLPWLTEVMEATGLNPDLISPTAAFLELARQRDEAQAECRRVLREQVEARLARAIKRGPRRTWRRGGALRTVRHEGRLNGLREVLEMLNTGGP